MSARSVLLIGAILCGTSVVLGAFGAHGLEEWLPNHFDDATKRLENWKTGVLYQMFHGLGLIGLGAASSICWKWRGIATGLMLLGVVLFSGGLYGWVIADLKWMVMVVPVGGLSMTAGWLSAIAGIVCAPRSSCGQGTCHGD